MPCRVSGWQCVAPARGSNGRRPIELAGTGCRAESEAPSACLMSRIALKIDVDTDRGTLEGVPRLVSLFERLDVRATFLLSLGPDQTGRAVKRAFRRGFMGKV